MLEIRVNGTVTIDGIGIVPQVELITECVDFTPRAVIEGPMISSIGLNIAVGVVAVILLEHIAKSVR